MQNSQRPRRIRLPFGLNAGSGFITNVPDSGAAAGKASYDQGFPPETFQPVASGGSPPSGQDVNGVLFDATGNARWLAAGGSAMFDASFATAIGGYPAYAMLASTTAGRIWQSTADNNMTDPDSAGAANWVAITASFGTDANTLRFPGKVDQWGEVVLSSTGEPTVAVNLAVPFANANYNIQVSPVIAAASTQKDSWVEVIRNSKTASGFSVQYQSVSDQKPGLDGFTWRCVGQV